MSERQPPDSLTTVTARRLGLEEITLLSLSRLRAVQAYLIALTSACLLDVDTWANPGGKKDRHISMVIIIWIYIYAIRIGSGLLGASSVRALGHVHTAYGSNMLAKARISLISASRSLDLFVLACLLVFHVKDWEFVLFFHRWSPIINCVLIGLTFPLVPRFSLTPIALTNWSPTSRKVVDGIIWAASAFGNTYLLYIFYGFDIPRAAVEWPSLRLLAPFWILFASAIDVLIWWKAEAMIRVAERGGVWKEKGEDAEQEWAEEKASAARVQAREEETKRILREKEELRAAELA